MARGSGLRRLDESPPRLHPQRPDLQGAEMFGLGGDRGGFWWFLVELGGGWEVFVYEIYIPILCIVKISDM